jgi:hypothetical protein
MEGFDTRFEDIVSRATIEDRSFFDELRQLEFEEKAPVQSAPGTTLEVVNGSTVVGGGDPLGIYPNEDSVDFSNLLAFEDTYPASSGVKETDSLAIVSSASTGNLLQETCFSTADQKSLTNTIDTSSWAHSGCSEVNTDFSFRSYLPPTSTATLSMYDVSGIGTNPSNNMPVNIETVQIDVPQSTPQANGTTTTHHQITGMSHPVGTRPAPGKAPKTKKKRMPAKGTCEYRQKRDRNNVAVRKSREKSKIRVHETEQRVKELEDENQRLQSRITLLTKELNVLKSLFTSVQPSTLKTESQSSATHNQ